MTSALVYAKPSSNEAVPSLSISVRKDGQLVGKNVSRISVKNMEEWHDIITGQLSVLKSEKDKYKYLINSKRVWSIALFFFGIILMLNSRTEGLGLILTMIGIIPLKLSKNVTEKYFKQFSTLNALELIFTKPKNCLNTRFEKDIFKKYNRYELTYTELFDTMNHLRQTDAYSVFNSNITSFIEEYL
jgi:hypothetical protein